MSIEQVANKIVDKSKEFGCDFNVVWNNHMSDIDKEFFTLNDVVNYIEDMCILKVIEERDNCDNGVRYSLDDLENIMNEMDI